MFGIRPNSNPQRLDEVTRKYQEQDVRMALDTLEKDRVRQRVAADMEKREVGTLFDCCLLPVISFARMIAAALRG